MACCIAENRAARDLVDDCPSRTKPIERAKSTVRSVSAFSVRSRAAPLHLRLLLAPSTISDASPKASISENAIGQVSERVVA